MFQLDWEPAYDRGTGVYATKHEPPQYVVRFEYTGGGASRSCAYATREEAEEVLREKLDWHAKHWRAQARRAASDPNVVVIDGHFYSVGEPRANRECSGFGGRQFFIVKHDGTAIETRNLWSGGEIPPEFRDLLPDNAEFVNGERWVELGGVHYLAGGLS